MTLTHWSRSIPLGFVLVVGTTGCLQAQAPSPNTIQGSPAEALAPRAPAAARTDRSTEQTNAAAPAVVFQTKPVPESMQTSGQVPATGQPSIQAPANSAIVVPPGAVISVPTGFSGQSAKATADDSLSSDMDPRRMVLNAVPMVQAVMAFLVLASILSWTLLFGKVVEILRKGRSLRKASLEVRRAISLSDIRDVDDYVVRSMVIEARDEIERSNEMIRSGFIVGLNDRVGVRLQRLEDDAGRRMSKGLNVLATIGSVTPFVGLFGTVWGIMHSFIGIAHTHTTSLAVVAPGIAEALLATSLGLLAAVPATIMYNSLGKRIVGHRARVADCISTILCLVSRDAERAQLPVRRPLIAAQG